MIIRTLFTAALLLTAPATAQTVTHVLPSPAAPAPVPALQHVRLSTTLGDIIIAVEVERAPISAANFLRYVDQRRMDGTTFYRALTVGTGYGLIQGGTRNEARRILRAIPHEPTTTTGLTHGDGAISFARGAPGTATGDFFITIGALTSLDAQPAAAGDNGGFAVFGRVVAGMDVVRAILIVPTDPNAGEGIMRGQMIAAPIRITTARRVDAPVAAPPVPPAEPVPPATAAPEPSA